MSWTVYRPGEGRVARFAALMAILGFGVFSAYRWYLWAQELDRWLPRIGAHQVNWGEVGAALLVIVFAMFGYRFCFVKQGSSDFLVETEIELRKVTWPEWKPLFRVSTELWGSAYVVILVVVALTLFIFAVDYGLQQGAQFIWYR